MHRAHLHRALTALLALGACQTAAPVPVELAAMLAEAPTGEPVRLWIHGNEIVRAAVPSGPGALPAEVRTTIDAVAPRGEMLFQGQEWGPRGHGFRIEKRYREEASEHVRSALIAFDGRVLERAHSVPIADVPQRVLATAMQVAPLVEEARIVSGPEREEYWSCTVRNRIGRLFLVEIGLDGRRLRAQRQVEVRAYA